MIKQRDWGNSCGGELWHFYTLHLRHHRHPSLPPSLTHPPPPRMLLYQHRGGRRGGRQKLSETGTRGEALLWHDARYQRRHPRLVMQRSYLLLVYTCTEPTRSKKKPQYGLIFCFRCTRQLTCESKIRAATTDRLAVTTDRLAVNYQINHRLIWVIFKRKNEIFSGFFPDLWQ